LLLAAGEEAAVPPGQLAQLREEIEHAVDREVVAAPVTRAPAGHVEVLPHREVGEDPPVFGHEAEAGARHPIGGPARAVPTPRHRMRPACGGVRPMMLRMVVVLPTPLRPSRQTHSPAFTAMETPKSTRDSP